MSRSPSPGSCCGAPRPPMAMIASTTVVASPESHKSLRLGSASSGCPPLRSSANGVSCSRFGAGEEKLTSSVASLAAAAISDVVVASDCRRRRCSTALPGISTGALPRGEGVLSCSRSSARTTASADASLDGLAESRPASISDHATVGGTLELALDASVRPRDVRPVPDAAEAGSD
eukprot:CAMPEP_0195088786 /NCGR_PEP_ID=MMETSP0448-20130528/28259_1 /TAXON_ID=66468 /ORGANISM="Heterocapsa triquestra, Strain CCMP 448" /LENGTH=175 /DNA_ID=CAMNT_0040122473 /DNA_START=5 /DNA_END=529 /DNA_ORIENTATION=-